jgi:hypothetical protein
VLPDAELGEDVAPQTELPDHHRARPQLPQPEKARQRQLPDSKDSGIGLAKSQQHTDGQLA